MKLLLAFAVLVVPVSTCRADRWPAWRGADGLGVSRETNLPVHWSTNQQVRWRRPLPAPGNSTPITWKQQVFLTQEIPGEQRALLCLDRATGIMIWKNGPAWKASDLTHETNYGSSSSPVTDGERVISYFGSAGLYCHDFTGKEIWRRDLGEQRHIWGYGSSPVIRGELCFLNFGPGPRQFLIAVNKRTGETVWQAEGPPGDSGESSPDKKAIWTGSWSTPLLLRAEGQEQLLLSWPGRLASYEPATGREIWSCLGLNPLAYTSPVFADGIAVAMGGYSGKDFAVKTSGSGDVTGTHRLWDHPKTKQRIGSGAIHEGRIYIHTDPGVAECIDLKTGTTVWEERLKGPGPSGVNWSSVMIANGLCYTITQGGDCFVFKASPQFEVVATNSLREASNSSIVPSDGQLFIRTHQALWCIEGRK